MDAGREKQRQRLSWKTGTDPVRVFPREHHPPSRGAPSAVTLQRCSPQSHSSSSGSGWASPAHGGCSGAASTPHPTPAPSRGMQDGGISKVKAPRSLGYPPAPGREVPPASRPSPGSGRAVGTVSISRGALLEKEQKPREAINSRLLHTSASSAPASRGRGGPAARPGPSPTAKPPPRLRANISI